MSFYRNRSPVFAVIICFLVYLTVVVSCDLPESAVHELVGTWSSVTYGPPVAMPTAASRIDIVFNTGGTGAWIESSRPAGPGGVFSETDNDPFSWSKSNGTVTLDFDTATTGRDDVTYDWTLSKPTLTLTEQPGGASTDYTDADTLVVL